MLRTFTLTVYDEYQRPGKIFEMVVRALSASGARDLACWHDTYDTIWLDETRVRCVDQGPYEPTSRVVGTKRRPSFAPVVDEWSADDT